jgi:hypothetical protein
MYSATSTEQKLRQERNLCRIPINKISSPVGAKYAASTSFGIISIQNYKYAAPAALKPIT